MIYRTKFSIEKWVVNCCHSLSNSYQMNNFIVTFPHKRITWLNISSLSESYLKWNTRLFFQKKKKKMIQTIYCYAYFTIICKIPNFDADSKGALLFNLLIFYVLHFACRFHGNTIVIFKAFSKKKKNNFY